MFVKIYFFFLLVNTMLGVGDEYASGNGWTATAASIQGSYLGPSFFNNTNPSGTLLPNFTDTTNATIVGHTGDNNFFDPITDGVNRLYMVGELIVDLITANFIVNVVSAFSNSIGIVFPAAFTFQLQMVMGFINILFIVYMITSKATLTFA